MSETRTDTEVISLLKQAVAGLVWMSETESQFDILAWQVSEEEPFTIETLLQSTDHSLDCPVQPVTLEALFQPVMQEQNWFGSEERQTAQQFQFLYQLLQETLKDLQVYRIGAVEVDLYIVGRLNPSKIIGLHTHAVET